MAGQATRDGDGAAAVHVKGAGELRAALPATIEPVAHRAYQAVWRLAAPLLNDRRFNQVRYLAQFGRLPDLDAPRTFNEKVLWRKLHDHRALFTVLCDKVAVREHVAARVGADHLIELYGVYEEPERIPWADLPGPCVVKPSHGSGWCRLVPEPARVDGCAVAPELRHWLRTDFSARWRERQYAGVPRRLVVERMLQERGASPRDYKFYCFDGTPHLVLCATDRHTDHKISFYDMSWRHVPMQWCIPAGPPEARPQAFDELLRVARRLSAGLDFVRVDLYEVAGRVYFGELTLTPNAGLVPVYPRERDRWLGSLWRLPETQDVT